MWNYTKKVGYILTAFTVKQYKHVANFISNKLKR